MAPRKHRPTPFFERLAADRLAESVIQLVEDGILDARCQAADDVLNYTQIRFGCNDSISELKKEIKRYPPRR